MKWDNDKQVLGTGKKEEKKRRKIVIDTFNID